MGYDLDYFGPSNLGSSMGTGVGNLIWIIVAFIIAVVGAFLGYFLFVNKNNKLDNKYLVWLRSFLRFEKMLIETVLKIAYMFAAIAITLVPFGMMPFFSALLTVVFGNILIRIAYELSMIVIMIWKNTNDIKTKLK